MLKRGRYLDWGHLPPPVLGIYGFHALMSGRYVPRSELQTLAAVIIVWVFAATVTGAAFSSILCCYSVLIRKWVKLTRQ